MSDRSRLTPAEAQASRRRLLYTIAVGVVLGIAIRLWVAAAAEGKSFSDNAVVALMAMHALRGKFYAFYWGQSYMGSLEPLVVAPFFALFGVSDRVLSAGLLPWWAAFAAAIALVTKLCAGGTGNLAAAIAVLLCAVAPAELQFFEITARGGYPATLAFGTTLLWLALRMVYEPMASRSRAWHVVAIGAIAGLAFWTNWLVLPYFVVVGFYLLTAEPRLPLRPAFWIALGAFLATSLPLWVYNWHEGFASFALVGRPADSPPRLAALAWALAVGVPNVVGVRDLHGVWLFGWAGRAFAAVALAGFVAGVVALRHSWLAIARRRIRDANPAAALFLLGIATVGVYVITSPNRFQIGRYLLPIASTSIPLAALGLARLVENRRAFGIALLVAVVGFYGAQTPMLQHNFRTASTRYTAGPIERLAEHLVRSGIRFAYADYGDAAVTTYFAKEEVILADYAERYYPMAEVDFRDPAIVLREDLGSTAATTLDALDAKFSAKRIPGYHVYWPIRYDGVRRFPLSRTRLRASANVNGGDASLILDGDPWTYWTAPSRGPLPVLTVDVGAEEEIAGVYLGLGERPGNAFHHLRVEASRDGSAWQLVKEARWDFPVTFRSDGQVSILPDDVQMVLFAPQRARWVRLLLLEAFSERNWSVGELAVFGTRPDTGETSVPIELPVFSDPTSSEALERRLRLEVDREPWSNRPLLDLASLYRKRGDRQRLETIERIAATRFEPQTLVGWQFGPDLVLVGYDWRALDARRFEITYYWSAARKMSVDYAIYAHFEGPGLRFQDDYVLGAPSHSTASWEAGEIVKEKRVVEVPANAPDGVYALRLGAWDPTTKRRVERAGSWWRRTSPILLDVAVDPQEIRWVRRTHLP